MVSLEFFSVSVFGVKNFNFPHTITRVSYLQTECISETHRLLRFRTLFHRLSPLLSPRSSLPMLCNFRCNTSPPMLCLCSFRLRSGNNLVPRLEKIKNQQCCRNRQPLGLGRPLPLFSCSFLVARLTYSIGTPVTPCIRSLPSCNLQQN